VVHERPTTRLVAGALAALWLALPLAAAVHVTVVAHEFCIEHQALEHTSDGTTTTSSDGAAIAASVASDLHDHCLFDEAVLQTARLAREAPTAAIAAPDTCVLTPAAADHPAMAVLATAPKTSPPLLVA
jgi:hypothetical protein